MTAQISNFLSSFTSDVARPDKFNVQIPIPIKLVAWRNIARTLSYRCQTASLPGIALETQERKIYGPTEQMPTKRKYEDIKLEFLVTDSMNEKKFFDAWIQLINPNTTYDMSYRSDYVTPITINQFDVTDKLRYSVTLIDAFPTAVNELDLGWNKQNEFHVLLVNFAYFTWEQNSLDSITSSLVDSAVSTGVDIVTSFIAQGSSFNPLAPSGSGNWKMPSVAKGVDASAADSYASPL